jgi:hypothetical protein
MIKPLRDLRKMASRRPPGYVEDVLSHATSIDRGTGTYEINDDAWEAMKAKYAAVRRCGNCGSWDHETEACPIPPDTSPAIERRRALSGGCCGPPRGA